LKALVYSAINGKSSAVTILLFELHPPLSRLHIKCWVYITRRKVNVVKLSRC